MLIVTIRYIDRQTWYFTFPIGNLKHNGRLWPAYETNNPLISLSDFALGLCFFNSIKLQVNVKIFDEMKQLNPFLLSSEVVPWHRQAQSANPEVLHQSPHLTAQSLDHCRRPPLVRCLGCCWWGPNPCSFSEKGPTPRMTTGCQAAYQAVSPKQSLSSLRLAGSLTSKIAPSEVVCPSVMCWWWWWTWGCLWRRLWAETLWWRRAASERLGETLHPLPLAHPLRAERSPSRDERSVAQTCCRRGRSTCGRSGGSLPPSLWRWNPKGCLIKRKFTTVCLLLLLGKEQERK